jgi:FlaA1/EpsC-like NDP-sugar epimerase
LRPGEKMREELFLPEEHFVETDHKKIFSLKQVDDMSYLRKEVEMLEKIIGADEELGLTVFMDQLLSALERCEVLDESSSLLPKVHYEPYFPTKQSTAEKSSRSS